MRSRRIASHGTVKSHLARLEGWTRAVPCDQRYCMFSEVNSPLFHNGAVHPAKFWDQRRFRRYGVRLPCRVRPTASGRSAVIPELDAETLDVSRGGLFLLASAALPVGTDIEFELDLPTRIKRRRATIRCQGTITRVVTKGGGRIGIAATIDHFKISTFGEGKQPVTMRWQNCHGYPSH